MQDLSRYIILRDKNAELRRRVESRSFPRMPGTDMFGTRGMLETMSTGAVAAAVPPGPDLEGADMTVAEAKDATHAPDVVSVVRSMPTRLVAPVDAGGSAAGGAGAAAAQTAWGINAVGAGASSRTGAGIKAAVLDTGIDADHPAFAGVTLTERDYTGEGNGDANGHGTHCAGTIFGRDVDGTRIGVARGVTEAFIGKVLNAQGSGTSEMMFDALKEASMSDVRVVSMSLGFDFPGLVEELVADGFPVKLATSLALEMFRTNLGMFESLMDMFRQQEAFDGGTLVIAAAGNESERDVHVNFEVAASVPAVADGCIAVGALGQGPNGLKIADFSNTKPDISAPGVGVESAKTGGGLLTLNGTSMACPHVGGVAALWWEDVLGSAVPGTATSVFTRLLASATTTGIAPDVQVADRGQGLVQSPS